jgi:hypothetical protein
LAISRAVASEIFNNISYDSRIQELENLGFPNGTAVPPGRPFLVATTTKINGHCNVHNTVQQKLKLGKWVKTSHELYPGFKART